MEWEENEIRGTEKRQRKVKKIVCEINDRVIHILIHASYTYWRRRLRLQNWLQNIIHLLQNIIL